MLNPSVLNKSNFPTRPKSIDSTYRKTLNPCARGTFIRKEKGFSLLEILIALTISFVLVIGVIQLYVNSSTSFRRADALARIQEDGRFAIDFMSKFLMQAGFRHDASADFETAFPEVTQATATNVKSTTLLQHFPTLFSAGQVVSGRDGGAAAVDMQSSTSDRIINGTDAVSIRFQSNVIAPGVSASPSPTPPMESLNGDGLLRDCMSLNALSNTTFSINTFYIGRGTSGEPEDQALFCEAITFDSNGGSTNDNQAIVPNVEDMEIFYGLDGNQDFLVDQYLPANEIATASEWRSVISVRIHLIVRSTNDGIQMLPEEAMDFLGNDVAAAQEVQFNDRRLRRQFVTTISLRNKML